MRAHSIRENIAVSYYILDIDALRRPRLRRLSDVRQVFHWAWRCVELYIYCMAVWLLWSNGGQQDRARSHRPAPSAYSASHHDSSSWSLHSHDISWFSRWPYLATTLSSLRSCSPEVEKPKPQRSREAGCLFKMDNWIYHVLPVCVHKFSFAPCFIHHALPETLPCSARESHPFIAQGCGAADPKTRGALKPWSHWLAWPLGHAWPSCHFDQFVMSTFIGKGVVLCCLIQDLHEDWRAQWSVAQPLGDKPDRDVGHGKARVSKSSSPPTFHSYWGEIGTYLDSRSLIIPHLSQRAQDLQARRRGRSLSGFTVFTMLFTIFGHCRHC